MLFHVSDSLVAALCSRDGGHVGEIPLPLMAACAGNCHRGRRPCLPESIYDQGRFAVGDRDQDISDTFGEFLLPSAFDSRLRRIRSQVFL